ncbi:hypothetical protein ACFFMM_01335 [Micromonospora chaiyaphumensis]|uniref:Flagellar basal body-associated protein FliL n=1 Tax=Micromonospora chaiyaphumensis TaxID=307119 RepID=A0A1C4Z8M8_9ACTN|nr:hypothetical protein [Micromonospora chaiyaphumensis]SCF29061.1 hypothetical protein GA0070214_11283 [Micromonospora chaiyaphumensis]
MSQPPSNPYPGSYPPHQQQPGGYQPPQQPQYGGGYPPAPQQQPQYGGGYPESGQPGQQYGGGYPEPGQPGQQYGGGYLETGQPGYGGAAPLPPKKKSSVGKILLIVLAVVLVLCVGGGVALWLGVKDEVGDVVTATKTRLVEPPTLAGRPKITEPELQSAATQMKSEIAKDVPNATSTVGAFYGEPAKKDMVMIAGASGVIADPQKEMADAITAITPQLGAKEFKTVDAGPMGGEAKCGDGKADAIPVAVCIWADKGSLGMVVVYFKSAAEVQPEFVTMRGEIEKQG